MRPRPGSRTSRPPSPGDEGSRRAALAEWIASPANMLTWRSIANRVWHYHFGRGSGRYPQRLRPQRRTADASRAARLAGRRAPRRRRVAQGAASLDRDECGLSPIVARRRGLGQARRRQPLALADEPPAARRRGAPRQRPGRRRHARSPRWAGPASRCFASRTTTRRSTTTPRPKRSTTPGRAAAPSIASSCGACRTRSSNASTAPTRISTRRCGPPRSRRSRRWPCSTTPSWSGNRRAFARRLAALADDPERQVDAAFALALGRPPRPAERNALVAYARKHGLANACRLLFNTNEFLFID